MATSIGSSSTLASTPANQIRVLMDFPNDQNYSILGGWLGTSFKGYTTDIDGSYSAYKRLKNCACLHGGNAIVLVKKDEKISYPTGSSGPFPSRFDGPVQQKVSLVGTVIYIY